MAAVGRHLAGCTRVASRMLARGPATAARSHAPRPSGALRACSSSSEAQPVAAFPLDRELPGIPKLRPARNLPQPTTHITTLENGLRVVSEENYGQVSGVGLFVDSGSMYEDEITAGCNHFLEILAFQSTANRTAEQVTTQVQEAGLGVNAAASREQFVYRVDALRERAEESVELLADTVVNPLFLDSEMEEARRVAEFQHMDISMNPHVVIQEALHAAAFGAKSPLGHTVMCSRERIATMSADVIREHVSSLYSADRMVLAAAGVDHSDLVAYAEKYFSGLTPTTPRKVETPDDTYYGGSVIVPDNPAAPQDYTHVIVGFPSAGWSTDDVVVECVLDTLLGGGSSFSAGGPGKGMYSRLYREVLNRYMWVETASAFSLQMAKVGLVGIYGAATPDAAGQLVNVIVSHFHRLVDEPVAEEDLARARNQLRSAVMMNLELRGVLCEDIGRQVLTSGKRITPQALCEKIAAVTAEDIQNLARKFVQRPPSMAVFGNSTQVPLYEDVKRYFADVAGNLK